MMVGACMPTSWMENIKPASSLIVKPRCGEQGNALLIWLASVVMRWRLRTKQSDMAKVLNMKGEPQIEIDIRGIPFYKELLRTVERFHIYLHERMSHDDMGGYDYLEVQTKVGWVEFHFNEERYE